MRVRTRIERRDLRLVSVLAVVLTGLSLADPSEAVPQSEGLPFAVGEELVFRMRVGTLGTVGAGSMRVEGPEEIRGIRTLRLRFDFRTRVGPVRAMDNTTSWLDPLRMASMRFEKRERHPLSSHAEAVELFPGERRWDAGEGGAGISPTSDPLDELSFMYFIRTLPLTPNAVYEFNRHFEEDRNPIAVRVLKRERITVGAGEFRTILVEMRVKDPRRYRGEGVIRINLSDDAGRVPVRIESTMPVLGRTTLTLESIARPVPPPLAGRP
jgi:hypothetical protein